MVKALAGLAFLLAVLAAALFAPAWTLDYWQAWTFLAVFAAATLVITIELAIRDPALLARRVQAGPVAEPERDEHVAGDRDRRWNVRPPGAVIEGRHDEDREEGE